MSGKITRLEDIKLWLASHEITDYNIRPDLTVDVNQAVYLNNKLLKEIPVQFGIVKGNFHCSHNNLTSLAGSPRIVQGHYNCSYNQLTDLKGAPELVEGTFNCTSNEFLVSLKGIPQIIKSSIMCGETSLKTLDYVPVSLLGSFSCLEVPLENIDNLKNCQFKGMFIHSCRRDSCPIDSLKEFYDKKNGVMITAQSMNAYFLMQKLSEKSLPETKKKKL